jgi:hypothetical protein
MAETTVARFPAAATTEIGATVDSLLALLLNIEVAQTALGRDREKKAAERIDAFAVASKTAVSPADALKAQLDFETLRKTYDDQEAALDFWEHAADDRLDRLATDYGDQVFEALERRLAQLRQREAIEQGDVDAVKSAISEIEARRQHLQSIVSKRSQKKGAAGTKGESA